MQAVHYRERRGGGGGLLAARHACHGPEPAPPPHVPGTILSALQTLEGGQECYITGGFQLRKWGQVKKEEGGASLVGVGIIFVGLRAPS